jgi:hypothetical protein
VAGIIKATEIMRELGLFGSMLSLYWFFGPRTLELYGVPSGCEFKWYELLHYSWLFNQLSELNMTIVHF